MYLEKKAQSLENNHQNVILGRHCTYKNSKVLVLRVNYLLHSFFSELFLAECRVLTELCLLLTTAGTTRNIPSGPLRKNSSLKLDDKACFRSRRIPAGELGEAEPPLSRQGLEGGASQVESRFPLPASVVSGEGEEVRVEERLEFRRDPASPQLDFEVAEEVFRDIRKLLERERISSERSNMLSFRTGCGGWCGFPASRSLAAAAAAAAAALLFCSVGEGEVEWKTLRSGIWPGCGFGARKITIRLRRRDSHRLNHENSKVLVWICHQAFYAMFFALWGLRSSPTVERVT